MANQDAAFGFRAIGGMGSSYETQGTSKYQINDNWTNAIFQQPLLVKIHWPLVFLMAVSISIQPLLNQRGKTITRARLISRLGK